MCLGILKGDAWKPSSKIAQVVTAAQQLLIEPIPEDAVDTDASDVFTNDRNAFNKRAKDDTKKYAK
jgi:ubiquitin-protein ligase